MNIKAFAFFFFSFSASFINAESLIQENNFALDKHIEHKTDIQAIKKKMVWFRYKDEPLTFIINDLAEKLGINILLPQGAKALTTKLTFELSHKISLSRAWNYLLTILNISGYTIIPNKTFSTIIKIDKNTLSKQELPLYINVPPAELPDVDIQVRYLRYLSNLQVPSTGTPSNALETLLTQMLSANSTVIYEPQLNALLIIDTIRNIKSAMTIVEELDSSTSINEPLILKLKHASADRIKELFGQLGENANTRQPNPLAKKSSSNHFPQNVRLVVNKRTNSLIILGKERAAHKVADFIKKYLDVPLGEGKSVLHIYNLQYLRANETAELLKKIVAPESETGQSSSLAGDHHFKNVIIEAESQDNAVAEGLAKATYNGNRLIIAATENDWIRIKKLIRALDKPEPQVTIHGLIVDLSYNAQKDLGNQIRDHEDLFIKNVHWQAGHIGGIETNKATSGSTALQSNLLPVSGSSNIETTGNMASQSTNGSFILSFKDPKTNGIWWLTRLLSMHSDTKILSQPFLTTMNNQSVSLRDAETRQILGAASGELGVQTQERITKEAHVTLEVLPRINNKGSISLSITVDIAEWASLVNNTQSTRKVVTNVNLNHGDILILGGLSKTKLEDSVNKTPLLGDVLPFFRSQNKTVTKSDLMIFLRPEIHMLDEENTTETMLKKSKELLGLSDKNFGLLQDPITRWFFGKDPKNATPLVIDHFQAKRSEIKIYETENSLALEAPEVDTKKRLEPKELSQEEYERAVKAKQKASKKVSDLFNFIHDEPVAPKKHTNETSDIIPLQENPISLAPLSSSKDDNQKGLTEEELAEKELRALFKEQVDATERTKE